MYKIVVTKRSKMLKDTINNTEKFEVEYVIMNSVVENSILPKEELYSSIWTNLMVQLREKGVIPSYYSVTQSHNGVFTYLKLIGLEDSPIE